jgi:hypothetical protein
MAITYHDTKRNKVLNRGRLAISISVVSATLPHHNMNRMNGVYRMNSHMVARVP